MSAPVDGDGGGAASSGGGGRLPLTVRDVLTMPAFARARLSAGADGLDNPVEWAHIVDMPDAAFDWGRRHVLLLTAGYGLGDEGDQHHLVERLVARGFAGIVLSLGYAVEETPRGLREAADAHDLPVIETPPEVLFITLTEAIFAQLVNRQADLLRRSADVRGALTDLVLRGGGLADTAETLAALLERSVTIEDRDLRVLATASAGPVDEARRRSIERGRTTPEIARHLADSGLYRDLVEGMGPVRVGPIPELGMTMERIVAPIIVDRDLQGYIWIIAGDAPLTDLDELALGHGATVAALVLLKERAVREAADSLRGDLLQRLLSAHTSSADLSDLAHRVGFDLDRPHQVLLVRAPAGAQLHDPGVITDRIAAWRSGAGVAMLAAARQEGIVAIVESAADEDGEATAERLVSDLATTAALLVGVGTLAHPARDPRGLRRSYLEARESADIGVALGDPSGVRPFRTLGLLHWLNHLPEEVRSGNPWRARVVALAAGDDASPDLLTTLEAYLEHGGSVSAAARALHVHRNTLLHRLDRLTARLGHDLRDPAVRLELHVALRDHRLHTGRELR